MRRANKANRASGTGGSLHTGGSITYPSTAKKMSLGALLRRVRYSCGPTQRKKIGETHKAEMKRLEDERAARIAAWEPAGPHIDEDEIWDRIAGGRKRGWIYGKGKAEEYRRQMEAWKQRYETDVTRLQTTIDTQSAQFDQWKSHVS
ncbi:hypothetical protein PIB30_049200 [Stylosanthes scabra]|uniref:Uncharacterized protein n=1 Tax=Stylosanthes scabra TaxID=79078 RepID=A0ABU6WFS5_9FABA|nr:hypothetical protein [Stylosanthes scabra]